jgi:methionine synthase II (cobalamin-independent)
MRSREWRRTTPPFRADHVGSLLRPDSVHRARSEAATGQITPEDLRAPLRFVPPGKMVVLGLVTTKRGALESKDELKHRIEAASRYVPLERLCLSPQCGFSSTVEDQLAQLRLGVKTAEEVWG